ncbi:MAG: hypothetical protein JWM62_1674 [Frankiales bacterium]|nr:hypothetical protein [Frankiales bacterium]
MTTEQTAAPRAQQQPALEARLLEAVGQAVIATDADGIVLHWNRAAQELYGWSAQEAVGRPIVELTPSSASRAQATQIMEALHSGLSWTGDFPVRRRDGSEFIALVTNRPLLDDEGRVCGVIGVSSDISERVHAELAARRMEAVVASMGDAVMTTSPEGLILTWNAAAQQLYGWSAEEAVGQHVSLLAPPGGETALAAMSDRLRRGESVRGETERSRRDGTTVMVSITISPVLDRDGRYVGASSIARDVTEQQAWQRALSHAALHDDLTGLPNRTLLADRLDQQVAASQLSGSPLSVLYVDLDAFKDVNEAQGHPLGDRVLVEVAHRLRAAVGPADTVSRFGGDEFVVLLPGTDEAAAGPVAERLLEAVRAPLELDGQRLHLSASIGVAGAPQADGTALLRAADAAVYDAKGRGRGQVSTFVGALSQQAEERLLLSGELRDALATDALHLVYQPIVGCGDGALLGLEALLRWEHPERGSIPPNTFVTVAEKTGLGRDLDDWVLRHACAEFSRLRLTGQVGDDVYLGINVTATNVVEPGFPATVEAALEAARLPASALVLEVTETGVMNDLDMGVRMLTHLTDLGVRIAIDDFGTGWSSLTYVRTLPATIIKLDRSFVARLHEDDADLAIAASVVELGRATRMTVVAEGVETQDQLAVLRRLRCTAAQGYLWHAGVRAEQLPEALATVAAVASVVAEPAARAPRQRLEVGPEHGLVRLWELHGDGASLATIAAALNREGFRAPSGHRWHGKTIARVVAEPSLASSYDEE